VKKKYLGLTLLILIFLCAIPVINATLLTWYEDDISGLVSQGTYDEYQIGRPYQVRVNIDTCSYEVFVRIMQPGDTVWSGILGPGESSGYKNCDPDYDTWVWIEHLGGTLMGVSYTGTIQYYSN
jgi:hypothetical protein